MSGEVERWEPPHTGEQSKSDGTDALDARVKTAHGAGLTQGETARELGVSRWTVRKASERMALEWPHAARTEAATKAAKAKASRDRFALLQRWTDLSHDLLDHAERATDAEGLWAYVRPAAVATDKAAHLAALALREPDSDGLEEARRHMTLIGATINKSAAMAQLARARGATEEEINAAHNTAHGWGRRTEEEDQ